MEKVRYVVLNHKVQIISIVCISFLILFLRRTTELTDPQFWAEDGSIWFSTAYNHFFSPVTLLFPYAGYLNLFARLVAVLSFIVGIAYVPLFFNTIALFVETVPIIYLWSVRSNEFLKSNILRLFLTILYLLLPFVSEINGNITNSQWYLAIVAFFILFIRLPINKIVRYLEDIFLFIICFSGPFSIFLSLVVVIDFLLNKKKIARDRIAILGVGALTQFITILLLHVSRTTSTVLFSIPDLFKIVGGQIFIAGLFGSQLYSQILMHQWVVLPIVSFLGIGLFVYVLMIGPRILKLYIYFSLLILVAVLMSPAGKFLHGQTYWGILAQPEAVGRYYLELHIALFLSLIWVSLSKLNLEIIRILASVIIIMSLILGVPSNIILKPYTDYHYNQFVEKFNKAPIGMVVTTTINPGPPFQVHITKH